MQDVTLTIDDDVLRKARQYAGEQGTTVEALLAEHLSLLADRAGRRLTLREQTYVDSRPSREVTETLRGEAAATKQKIR